MQYAYVTTLCGGDAYLPGVEVLGRSLMASGTREARLAMVTPDVSTEARRRLQAQGWVLVDVDPIENPTPETGQLYPRFAKTFTKLRAFGLAYPSKVVLLDADTVVLRNIDDLFERPSFAAAPDFFLPDRFNSGVMVVEPSPALFAQIHDALSSLSSYDGGGPRFPQRVLARLVRATPVLSAAGRVQHAPLHLPVPDGPYLAEGSGAVRSARAALYVAEAVDGPHV